MVKSFFTRRYATNVFIGFRIPALKRRAKFNCRYAADGPIVKMGRDRNRQVIHAPHSGEFLRLGVVWRWANNSGLFHPGHEGPC
jgi:hypothetical protein